MYLTDKQIKEFQKLYFKYYNEDINKEVAYEKSIKLLCFLKNIYKPITTNDLTKIEKNGIL